MSQTVDAEAFNRFEAAGWDSRAEPYDRFLAKVTERVIEPLLDAAGVGSGMRVLDVGTGPGHAAAAAATRGATVVGVDVAPRMVAYAQNRHPGIEFRQGDAENLPFEDGALDALTANFVVLHLGRPERGITEFSRCLRRGGRLAFTVWDLPKNSPLQGVFVEAVQRLGVKPPPDLPAGPPIYTFAREESVREVLEPAGFDEVTVQQITFTHLISSLDELWQGMLDSGVRFPPTVFSQPPDVQRQIREEVDRLAGRYASGEGLEMPVSVVLTSARKV